MMKRILSLILVFALICVLVLPVTARAAESGSAWIELLRFGNVNGEDDNYWQMPSGEFTCWVPTPFEMRCCKVDLILTHTAGTAPTKVELRYNNNYYKLTTKSIDSTTTRVYGDIPDTFYKHLYLRFTRPSTTTSYYEIVSCRVTQLAVQDTPLDAYARLSIGDYQCPFEAAIPGGESGATGYEQYPIVVDDWQKYDYLTFVGSITYAALNSVRVTIGGIGVPFEMTYCTSPSTGSVSHSYAWSEWKYYSFDESYKGTTEDEIYTFTEYNGKVLYCITVDLTNIDRNNTQPLMCYFTFLVSGDGSYLTQCVGATGSVLPADTSEVIWWNRFTDFMSDLFGSDDGQESIDDLQQSSSSISQGASDIQAFEQSQQAVLDTGMTTIQNAVSYTSFMTALVFVQKYANMTFDGISKYAIVFTLPLFLGLFFYLCSRIPGITRWKPRSPKSEGGDSP